MGNFLELYKFLKKQEETYQFYHRVWVQHIDKINQCTVFTFQKIEIDNCNRLSPFICEMGKCVSLHYKIICYYFFVYKSSLFIIEK